MKNKEIEEILKDIKDKYSYEPYDNTGNVYTTISYEEGQLLLSYIEQLEKRIYKARKMIFDNYGVLDKYEIEMLDDILKGDSDE